MSYQIPRQTYADLYGPTKGDRIRLADTDLFLEIEKDFELVTAPPPAISALPVPGWAWPPVGRLPN